MKKTVTRLLKVATIGLTSVIAVMPLFTCFFLFHQPKLPEEINDFRKYDK